MTFLKEWLLGLIAAAMVVTLADALLPAGRLRSALRSCGGVLLFLTLVQPLRGWKGGELRGYQTDIDAMTAVQIAAYEQEHLSAMESIISGKCSAYISETAAALGLTCHAQVTCRTENGVPLPREIALDIPCDLQLSRRIADELGIDAEHQYWQEG